MTDWTISIASFPLAIPGVPAPDLVVHNFHVLQDSDGNTIAELHGLATDSNGDTKAIGGVFDASDTLGIYSIDSTSINDPRFAENFGSGVFFSEDPNTQLRPVITGSRSALEQFWSTAENAGDVVTGLNPNYAPTPLPAISHFNSNSAATFISNVFGVNGGPPKVFFDLLTIAPGANKNLANWAEQQILANMQEQEILLGRELNADEVSGFMALFEALDPALRETKADLGSGKGSRVDISKDAAFKSEIVSPLVIDLDSDGIELISLGQSDVFFDVNLDGYAENTGWVAADDGLLALDVDGDGKIADNSELFGDQTGYANGFLALGAHDSNADGVIDANDAVFSDLIVWQDADGDGFSSVDEMLSLTEAGITSIDLGYVNVNETNAGHSVLQSSTVTFSDGSVRDIDDVYFENDPRASVYLLPDNFQYHEDAFKLPVLFGYGKIASTWVVLSHNAALRADAVALLGKLELGDVSGFLTDFEDFILGWADVASVDPASRGEYVDARKLAFLEAAYGEAYVQEQPGILPDLVDPGSIAATALEAQFDELVLKLAGRFIAQSAVSEALLTATDQASFDATVSGHVFEALSALVTGYAQDSRSLSGDVQPAFDSLVASLQTGDITAGEAANLLHVLHYDLEPDVAIYTATLDGFATANGAAEAHLLSAAVQAIVDGDALVVGTSGNDTIASTVDSVVYGGLGDDFLDGGSERDTYLYASGDGSDTIEDLQGWYTRPDQIVFVDLNSNDVKFGQNSSFDLTMTTPDGSVITVLNQFSYGQSMTTSYEIETISFADGVALDLAGIRAKSVEDQKSTGTVIGTKWATTYYHDAGDGAYEIFDVDSNLSRVDRLVFNDLNFADASFAKLSNNDLVISFANGDQVTVDKHFQKAFMSVRYNNKIEEIEFADGTILGFAESWGAAAGATNNSDLLSGSGYLAGLGGNDTITGGAEEDYLYGGEGDDQLDGGWGEDYYFAGAGDDLILGNFGADYFDGGSGKDTVDFTYTTSNFSLSLETNTVDFGNNLLEQIFRIEVFIAGSGDNALIGDAGANEIDGGGGSDTISGRDGDDILSGGTGNDRIAGENGNDLLTGGTGADVFIFALSDTGEDTVTDFEFGLDQLDISAWGASDMTDLSVTSVQDPGSSLHDVTVGRNGDSFKLEAITSSQLALLDADDFVF